MSKSFKLLGVWEDEPLIPDISAVEHDNHQTLILDQFGQEIYRQRRPIGFGRDKEWQTRKYLSHKS